jgi:tRNA-dihydrouridine synthase B
MTDVQAPTPTLTTTPPEAEAPVAFSIGGRIPIRNRVFAAPMCGASKVPYRRMARRWGADIAYTEMVKAYPLVRDDRKTKELLVTAADEAPCGPQICGGDPDTMGRAAAVLEGMGFPLVDINMGCPVKRVVNEGAGAALLKDPAKVEAVVRACVQATSVPVTVKLRSGWSHQGHADAVALVRAAEQGGAALITIHGRPRTQHHNGDVDFASIARAKQAISVPLVANGGIQTADDAVRMLRETGCDAVMIGRGAYGRPWLFRDVARALTGRAPLPAPGWEGICDIMEEHLEGMVALMGPVGVRLYRKYAAWYFRDLPWGAHFRDVAYRTSEPDVMRDLLRQWRAHTRACAAAEAAGERPPVPAFLEGDPRAAEPFPARPGADDDDDGDCG